MTAIIYRWEDPATQPFGGDSRAAIAGAQRENRLDGPDAVAVLRSFGHSYPVGRPTAQRKWRMSVRSGVRTWWIDRYGFVLRSGQWSRLTRPDFLDVNRRMVLLFYRATRKLNDELVRTDPKMRRALTPDKTRLADMRKEWGRIYDRVRTERRKSLE